MKQNFTRLANNGFTLLEMVFIISIIGVMFASFVSFYTPYQTAKATQDTKVKMNVIFDALARYALLNNRIPCQANPTEATNPGVEAGCGGAVQGIVPYVTLGLTQDDAKDGFGRYMTYTVSSNVTGANNTPIENTSRFCSDSTSILIHEAFGSPAVDRDIGNSAAVVLISHGIDGAGGYNMSRANAWDRGNQITGVIGGARENANSVGDNSAWQINVADYNGNNDNNHFDDIVSYITSRGLVTRLGMTYCH